MSRHPSRSLLAVLALVALVGAACGQKEGVHVTTGGQGQVATGPGTGFGDAGLDGGADPAAGDPSAVDPATGQPVDPAAGGSDPSGPGGGTSTGGTSTRGGTGGGSGGATGGGQTGGGQQSGGQQSGQTGGPAWGSTVVIGIHAPITGAAPLPSSFREAAELYEGYINGKGGIHGRKVDIRVADDEYSPSVAVTRCKELVQRDNAFLLVGGGGTDQIQACARYAESAGVPYLSAGVTENGLRSLKGYFAVSMSYPQQGPYLASFIKQTYPDRVNNAAMVYSASPNFDDAVAAFQKAMPGSTTFKKMARDPSSTELANVARELCVAGVKVAYPLMAPADWLTMLRAQTCDIKWVGVGLTMGLNTVASVGCKDDPAKFDGSTFFSPFPGVDKAPGMDPEFAAAVKGKGWDDIFVALFSVNRAIGELLNRAGPNLTRAGFVQTAASAKDVATGLHPPLNFSPQDHFGADTVHVLRADCSKSQYITAATFAKF